MRGAQRVVDRLAQSPEVQSRARERLGELMRQQTQLSDLCSRLDKARGPELERLWQTFFLQYDEFVDAIRKSRAELRAYEAGRRSM